MTLVPKSPAFSNTRHVMGYRSLVFRDSMPWPGSSSAVGSPKFVSFRVWNANAWLLLEDTMLQNLE
jgi:hypothetical protein